MSEHNQVDEQVNLSPKQQLTVEEKNEIVDAVFAHAPVGTLLRRIIDKALCNNKPMFLTGFNRGTTSCRTNRNAPTTRPSLRERQFASSFSTSSFWHNASLTWRMAARRLLSLIGRCRLRSARSCFRKLNAQVG